MLTVTRRENIMAITHVFALCLVLALSGHGESRSNKFRLTTERAMKSRVTTEHITRPRVTNANATIPRVTFGNTTKHTVTTEPVTKPRMTTEKTNTTSHKMTMVPMNWTVPLHTMTTPPTTPPTTHAPMPTSSAPRPRGLGGCRKLSACVCETEDGARVDLSPLARNDHQPRFLDVPDPNGQYTYSWNPCTGFDEGLCQNVGLCQYVPGSSPDYYNLGNQSSVDFEVSSDQGLVMRYTGEGGYMVSSRLSYVTLVCDPEREADFTVQGEAERLSLRDGIVGVYYFTLRSRYACLRGGQPTTTLVPTPPVPSSVTVTAGPDPVYNLKTVVDLLFCLLVAAVVAVVVLLLLLVAVMSKHITWGQSRESRDSDVSRKEKLPLP